MPYIDQVKRNRMDNEIEYLATFTECGGDLNYVFARLVTLFVAEKGKSYSTLSEAKSALTDCADEFYAVVMRPYEESKRIQNGDVWNEVL